MESRGILAGISHGACCSSSAGSPCLRRNGMKVLAPTATAGPALGTRKVIRTRPPGRPPPPRRLPAVKRTGAPAGDRPAPPIRPLQPFWNSFKCGRQALSPAQPPACPEGTPARPPASKQPAAAPPTLLTRPSALTPRRRSQVQRLEGLQRIPVTPELGEAPPLRPRPPLPAGGALPRRPPPPREVGTLRAL